MKILIACNRDSYKNPYVSTLADGLIEQGVDVTCSISEFWNHATAYDIIHVQWPNLLVDKNDEECTKLYSIINDIHKAGKKFMCTCHNIVPHYNSGKAINKAYRIVYENCDCIQHLGEASIQLLKDAYPNMHAEHVLVPHHTYDELYNLNVSKEEARKRLNIPMDKKVIMSFGSFRCDEERNLVINLRKQLKSDEYYYLTPGFYRAKILRKDIKLGFEAFCKTIKYTWIAKKHNLHIAHRYIPDDMLPYYMAAADVMLIQRVKILNSGNVPLAMLAGLPIVGPDDGNVETMLRETGNYVFNKENPQNLEDIVYSALLDQSIGIRNRAYAMLNLTTSSVAIQLIDKYKKLI